MVVLMRTGVGCADEAEFLKICQVGAESAVKYHKFHRVVFEVFSVKSLIVVRVD